MAPRLLDFPLLIFLISLATLAGSTRLGVMLARRRRQLNAGEREDFSVVLAATLTLLGLIIGFTFSMALNRYDQRKDYEEAEANAIGTEILRIELLATADAARVRRLLATYLDQRIKHYEIGNLEQRQPLEAQTAKTQRELWIAVKEAVAAQPTPLTALVVTGMNDVLNSQGYTQAAWWNRIPLSAWLLMAAMAVCSTALVGYGAKNAKGERGLMLVLPLIVSIAFFLIADIDSPRGGFIRVVPQNLLSLAESLRAP